MKKPFKGLQDTSDMVRGMPGSGSGSGGSSGKPKLPKLHRLHRSKYNWVGRALPPPVSAGKRKWRRTVTPSGRVMLEPVE